MYYTIEGAIIGRIHKKEHKAGQDLDFVVVQGINRLHGIMYECFIEGRPNRGPYLGEHVIFNVSPIQVPIYDNNIFSDQLDNPRVLMQEYSDAQLPVWYFKSDSYTESSGIRSNFNQQYSKAI